MGKKVYFLDSVEQSDGSYDNTYGVDDVNAIVSNLVGAGVAPFPSGNTYDVSELNSLTSALVAEGTSLDGLKVSFADNKIHIAQGIGYFENGATIVVDSDGEELDYNVAETLYVYAEYNQALNTCGFYTSENKPVSGKGIYVLILATISADRIVTDKRVIAQSKVATLGRNVSKEILVKEYVDDQSFITFSKGDIIWSSDFDFSRFNCIYVSGNCSSIQIRFFVPIDELCQLEQGTEVLQYRGGNFFVDISIRYQDGKIEIYLGDRASGSHWIYWLRVSFF